MISRIGIFALYQFGILSSTYNTNKRYVFLKNRLQELRKEKGYTQLKVAIDLNLNQNSISRYENGEREAGYDLLCKFADYYNVTIDYILHYSDSRK